VFRRHPVAGRRGGCLLGFGLGFGLGPLRGPVGWCPAVAAAAAVAVAAVAVAAAAVSLVGPAAETARKPRRCCPDRQQVPPPGSCPVHSFSRTHEAQKDIVAGTDGASERYRAAVADGAVAGTAADVDGRPAVVGGYLSRFSPAGA
jgi:hypothetical protein